MAESIASATNASALYAEMRIETSGFAILAPWAVLRPRRSAWPRQPLARHSDTGYDETSVAPGVLPTNKTRRPRLATLRERRKPFQASRARRRPHALRCE